MKRSLEEESGEAATLLGENRDIWTQGIFPYLYKESFSLWLNLQLVSKQWYQMIRDDVTELRLTRLYEGGDAIKMCKVVKTRFRGKLTKLEAHSQGVLYIVGVGGLTSLKELILLSGCLHGMTMDTLTGLTSLTLHRQCSVELENLKSLTYLSHMYMCKFYFISSEKLMELPNLKHLCIGRSMHTDDRPFNFSNYSLDGLQLEYLESNSSNVFSSYTGYGKRCCPSGRYYEGNWLNGRRHGEGVHGHNMTIFKGVWNRNNLRNGEIIYPNGNHYRGEISIYRPHGVGIMSDTNGQVWKGKFRKGRIV